MIGITWLDVLCACVVGVALSVRGSLHRRERAREVEAERREAYWREVERQAAEFAAETLAHDEAEMARLVEWHRKTSGTGDARPEGS
jgi:hypothetical protein